MLESALRSSSCEINLSRYPGKHLSAPSLAFGVIPGIWKLKLLPATTPALSPLRGTSFSWGAPPQDDVLRARCSSTEGLPCASAATIGFLALAAVPCATAAGDLVIVVPGLSIRTFNLCYLKCWSNRTFQMPFSAAPPTLTPPMPGLLISLFES